MKTLSITLLGLVALAAAAQEATYDFVFRPKKDVASAYRLTMAIDAEGQKIEIESDIRLKVVSVAENGDYEIERTVEKGRVKFGSEETETPAEDPEIERYNAKGERLPDPKKKDQEEEPDDILTHTVDVMTDVTPDKPVKVGDSWHVDVKEDKKAELPSAKLDFKLLEIVKVDGADCLKVSVQYAVTEGSATTKGEGTVWLEKSDYTPVRFDLAITDLLMDADAKAKADVKVKLERR